MSSNTTLIIIPRAEIERCDIDRVAKCLAPERFTPSELAGLCGAVRLRFEHAASPDDLFVVPAARRFIRGLHQAWPWAGYFLRSAPISDNSPRDCVRDAGVLVGWGFCFNDEIAFARRDEPYRVSLRFNHEQFVASVEEIVNRAAELCAIAGRPKHSIHQRQKNLESTIASFFALGEQRPS